MITEYERRQLKAANDSGRVPAVFIHGLWLLAGSWDGWKVLFEDAGFAAIAPQWPDDQNQLMMPTPTRRLPTRPWAKLRIIWEQ